MNESSKMPYLLVAVGGAVGYFFFTNSGRRLRDSMLNMESSAVIPDKIEDARRFVEKHGRDVGYRVREVVDHLKVSIDEGKRTFDQSGERLERRMEKLSQGNNEVVANVHRAIDNLNSTILEVERSVLEPIYEVGSIVQGVQSGVRRLIQLSKCGFSDEKHDLRTDNSGEMESSNFGIEPALEDFGRERIVG